MKKLNNKNKQTTTHIHPQNFLNNNLSNHK